MIREGVSWIVSTRDWMQFGNGSMMPSALSQTKKQSAVLMYIANKRCILVACAGGTGRGTLECLTQLERGLTHMGMRVYDRIPVVRYNRDYILPALVEAGKTYIDRLENGFDMYY